MLHADGIFENNNGLRSSLSSSARRPDDEVVVNVNVRRMRHRLARRIELLNMCRAQRKYMLVGLEGGADWIDVARSLLHFDMVAQHQDNGFLLNEFCQPRRAASISGPVLHGEQPRIEHVASQEDLHAWVVHRNVRSLMARDRKDGQVAASQIEAGLTDQRPLSGPGGMLV